MRAVFADTFYFLALLDSAEQRHVEALEVTRKTDLRLVTTEWVIAAGIPSNYFRTGCHGVWPPI
jgi:predicted nucleic acid-binding protein